MSGGEDAEDDEDPKSVHRVPCGFLLAAELFARFAQFLKEASLGILGNI